MKLILSSLLVLLSAAAITFVGCAGSAESSASMASISSISASISGVAAASNSEYQSDVRIATAAAFESGASGSDLLQHVSAVANQHGISDWEAESSTYVAIGQGLRLGGANTESAEELANLLSKNNADAGRLLLQAYHA
jgi:hypothetical protein